MVLARAVAPMRTLAEYCAGYVKKGGVILAYKGPALPRELSEASHAFSVLHLKLEKTLTDSALKGLDHAVAVIGKQEALSLQYPRKQSKIKNNPL